MAATTKTRKTHARKAEKRYTWLTFDSGIFEEDFTFPKQEHMPLGVIEGAAKGDISKLLTWLEKAGADEADLEAMRELDSEELSDFMSAWGKGELANAPKSSER